MDGLFGIINIFETPYQLNGEWKKENGELFKAADFFKSPYYF
jgi:hypothetical protein